MATVRTHYDNLKVARDAPPEVIRAAYKVLSQRYHPDRNEGDPRAAHAMKIINSSYAVLSDPDRRREHDAWIVKQEAASQKPEVDSQPRQQKANPPPQLTRKRSLQGMLKHGMRFWPAYALGGVLLWVVISDPAAPKPGPKPYQATPQTTQLATTPEAKKATCKLVGKYGRKDGSQGTKIYRCDDGAGTIHYSSKPLSGYELDWPDSPEVARSPVDTSGSQPGSPLGTKWPDKAAYIPGLPKLNLGGLSTLTVDNSENDADVFVKLVSLDEDLAFPVRQFFIPRSKKFVVRDIQAGRYDLRYEDLNTHLLWRSEDFELVETSTEEGTRFSEVTMTLYKVQNGNLQTYALDASEF